MQNPKIDPAKAQQTFIVIWFALFVSQFLFLLLVYFTRPEVARLDLSQPLLDKNALVVIVIAAFSITDLTISFAMRKKYLDQAIAEQNINLVSTALIVGCALNEAISLFGVVLAFAFEYPYFWLFSALGIFGTILHFPRRSNIEAAAYRLN